MKYLKNYGISEDQIKELKEIYNDGIIKFLTEEKDFVVEKLEYLQNKGYYIFPILRNNIKIFLETMKPLEEKIRNMEKKGYTTKMIQMVLIYDLDI